MPNPAGCVRSYHVSIYRANYRQPPFVGRGFTKARFRGSESIVEWRAVCILVP